MVSCRQHLLVSSFLSICPSLSSNWGIETNDAVRFKAISLLCFLSSTVSLPFFLFCVPLYIALCYDSTFFPLLSEHLLAELFQGLEVIMHPSNSTLCASHSFTSWAAQAYTSVFPFPSSHLCAAVVTCLICTCYTTHNTLLLFFISTINLLLVRQMTKENVYVHQQAACWYRAATPLSCLCAPAALLPRVQFAGDESLA